jgi:hypothetical protein
MDGVDIISMSISGTIDNLDDSTQVAFKNAAAARIFVAVSGGNGDPETEYVNHPSPWLTTVAASTLPRSSSAGAILGNGISYQGVGLPASPSPVGPYPLVLSDSAGLQGVDVSSSQLCFNGSLDPAKVSQHAGSCWKESVIITA